MCPVARCRRGLRRDLSGSALPTLRNPFHAGHVFRGFTGSPLLRPVRLLAPLDGSDRVSPATGGFYIQASGGLVALPAAGYDYNSNWTPLLAGLSPAGMAASLAAPDPSRPGSLLGPPADLCGRRDPLQVLGYLQAGLVEGQGLDQGRVLR